MNAIISPKPYYYSQNYSGIIIVGLNLTVVHGQVHVLPYLHTSMQASAAHTMLTAAL